MPAVALYAIMGGAVLVILMAGGILLVEMLQRGRLATRIALATRESQNGVTELRPEGAFLIRILSQLGMRVARSGVLSGKTLSEMTATLEGAGFRGGKSLGLLIGAKIVLTLLLPFLLLFGLRHFGHGTLSTVLKIGVGAACGLIAPEMIAGKIRKNHLARVEAGVPDALDMLVICADAGLALEAGLARVAQEMTLLNADLAMELTQTSRELQIGSDMRRAMESLGDRTGLVTLKRLATTLIQSLQFGTPLTQALRTLSAEIRQEALVKFEERAGRLPTLMTLPMIVFILPCVFLIVAGPAMINVMATMHHMK
jgi:tight adherence protein C